jgi:carbamoyl-phosphate synthase/aspartate carbamoyltransferase
MNDVEFNDCGVMVLGSGVYRIGSSVEFRPQSWPSGHFVTIGLETILDIYDAESARGVILSMGGQTPNNIALPLYPQNVKTHKTSPDMIDTVENRFKFSRLLDEIGVDLRLSPCAIQWGTMSSFVLPMCSQALP